MTATGRQIPISDSEKKILNTMKDEYFPVLGELKKIMVSIQTCRIFFNLFSYELKDLGKEYNKVSKNFFAMLRKFQTPDLLFEGLAGSAFDHMSAYFKYQMIIQNNINEGLKYIEIIDRTLDRKTQIITNTRTLILAILALLISLIVR